jgi:hypothetical protein
LHKLIEAIIAAPSASDPLRRRWMEGVGRRGWRLFHFKRIRYPRLTTVKVAWCRAVLECAVFTEQPPSDEVLLTGGGYGGDGGVPASALGLLLRAACQIPNGAARRGPLEYPYMPRYFFSLENGRRLTDPEGEELAGHEAARVVALQIAHEFARNRDNLGSLRIVIRTPDHSFVGEVRLKDAPL